MGTWVWVRWELSVLSSDFFSKLFKIKMYFKNKTKQKKTSLDSLRQTWFCCVTSESWIMLLMGGPFVHQSQSSRGGAVGEGACLPFPTNSLFALCSHLSHSIPPETKDSSACITKNDWSSPDPTENVQRKERASSGNAPRAWESWSWDPTGQAPETIPQVLPRLSPVSLEFLEAGTVPGSAVSVGLKHGTATQQVLRNDWGTLFPSCDCSKMPVPCISESVFRKPETNTTLWINYIPIWKF